jgi:hypothetical protein
VSTPRSSNSSWAAVGVSMKNPCSRPASISTMPQRTAQVPTRSGIPSRHSSTVRMAVPSHNTMIVIPIQRQMAASNSVVSLKWLA